MNILFSIAISVSISFLFSSTFRYKQTNSISILIFLINIILLSICNIHGIHLFSILLVETCYIFIMYELNISDFLKYSFMYLIYMILCIQTSIIITNIFGYFSIYVPYDNPVYAIWIITCFILLVYCIFSDVLFANVYKKIKLPEYTIEIIFLPHCVAILLPFVIEKSKMGLLFYIIALIVAIGIEYIFIKTIQALHSEHEKTLSRYMETSNQNKYNLLNQQYQGSFNLLHELMHTCNELVMHMKNKNYEKVEHELEHICDATFKEFNDIYSNSVVFNTLLSNRKELLQKHNIHIKSTIEFNNFEFITFSNQVDLFNTILDFILEEAIQSKTNKVIFIKSNVVAEQVILSFRFANNKNKNLQGEIQAALSSILNNYNAILSINDIDENTTSLLLLFPNQK